ncbi:MAG: Abi-alpha family protein [Rhodobacteraceae bacterium]|nr:Abi-alpha family protein [Paracoccaceae bacterium]
MQSDEEAKAKAAAAESAGKAIDAARDFGEFVARYIGGSLEQGLGIFEDKLRYMRWERQVRLMRKAEELLKELGLPRPSRPVAMKIAIPLFQAASLEEDDEIQDIWAALLVNAANADCQFPVKRIYIGILENLSPYEARILDSIYSVKSAALENGIWTKDLPEEVHLHAGDGDMRPNQELELALATLDQLGLISSRLVWNTDLSLACVGHTTLGRCFINACKLQRPESAS